jgi:hypothetical protein
MGGVVVGWVTLLPLAKEDEISPVHAHYSGTCETVPGTGEVARFLEPALQELQGTVMDSRLAFVNLLAAAMYPYIHPWVYPPYLRR